MKALFISIAASFLFMSPLMASAQKGKEKEIKEIGEVQLEKKKTGFGLMVNAQDEAIEMTRVELGSAVFYVHSYDLKADSEVKIKELKIKYPGQRAYTVLGNTLDDEARRFLALMKKGDQILVFGALAEKPDMKVASAITITLKD